jgi:hypothetical protein
VATSRKLNLSRDQLAAFLGDHEQIRQFERLFLNVDQEIPALIEALQGEVDGLQGEVDGLQGEVEELQSAPPPREPRVPRYGTFYDTTTQTAAAANTAYPITFNTTDLSRGVYRGSPTSRIVVDREGIYNFQFSAQLDNTSGSNHLIFIWCRKNGVDVAQSASQVALKGADGELVAAWNFVLQMKALDYFELVWSVNNTAVQILAQAAAAPVPAIPSVLLTVTNNIEGYA